MKCTLSLPFGIRDLVTAGLLVTATLSFCAPVAAAPGDNYLVSYQPVTLRAAGSSTGGASLSGTGRYVAFGSSSETLVPEDTNGFPDVFVRDRATGVIERISVGAGGVQSNWVSESPSITPDGRYVVFESWASNLAPGDTNGFQDVYVFDRQTAVTRRVSTRPNRTEFGDSCESGGISDDGRYIAFSCRYFGVYFRDMSSGVTTLIAQQASLESYATINGNGRYVTYKFDFEDPVYVFDRVTGSKEILPGVWGVLSPDGRWYAYESDAAEVSTDVNGLRDIYLLDRSTGGKRLVSVAPDGRLSTSMSYYAAAVSADGRYVAFDSSGDGLVQGVRPDRYQLLIKDMSTGALEYVTSDFYGASLSRDTRFVAFGTEIALSTSDRNGTYGAASIDTYVHELGQSSTVPLVYIYELRPSRIDFGAVPLGSSLAKGFQLVNSGSNTALPITVVELTGMNPRQFVLKSNCKSPLALWNRCWISVSFKPSSVGYKQAQLHVVAGGVERYRSLSGSGVR